MPGIAAHEEKLLNLLWSPTIYEVPPYQRNFAWDAEQTAELWSDLLRTSRGKETYFLGSMVFVKTETSVVFEILDGQQRFASLSLILAALRDILRERQPASEYLKNVQDTLSIMDLSGKYNHQETARLHLNERDSSFFTDIVRQGVVGTPTHASHRLLAKAYGYFRERITEEVDEKGSHLEILWTQLVEAFSERLYVIRIEVDDVVDAQMVFEALNSAGLDLTVADLIKNYLLRESPEGKRADAYKTWTAVADLIEDDANLTTFVKTYWNSKYEFARKDKIYKQLRETVRKPPLEPGQVDVNSFLKDLQKESQQWMTLRNASVAGPVAKVEQLNQDLQDLQRLGAVLVYVPLLALRHVYEQDLATFATCVRWLRDFYVRHTIVGRRAANEVEEPSAQWAVSIRNGKLSPSELHAELLKLAPKDSEFIENFKKIPIRTQRVARLLLARINDAADPGNNITQTISTGGRVHLEHIIPQNPTHWSDFLDEEGLDHEEVLHNIGNLTLLVGPRNIEVSNLPFVEKQDRAYSLGDNIAPINSSLALWDKFGVAELEARQEWLASVAVTIWRLA